MNYKIPKLSKKQSTKAVACLTVFVALFLGSLFFFHSEDSQGTLPNCVGYSGTKSSGINCVYPSCATISSPSPGTNCLPSCSALTADNSVNGSATPSPGVNCYFYDLPTCTKIGSIASVIDTGVTAIPRSNCLDLIDLPLCSQMDSAEAPLKNCVNECDQTSDLSDTNITGHNVSCVRFCNNLPTGMTAIPRNVASNSVGNCIYRSCHQLDIGTLPTVSNCKKAICNTLFPDELYESRIQNENDPYFSEYCDGSDIKCYEFTASQLPYVRYRANNTMCQIHDCQPSTASCGKISTCTGFTLGSPTTDDTLNVTCNNTSLTFNDGTTKTFEQLYSTYINIGLPMSDTSICSPVACKPVIYTPYPCLGDSATIRNASCDTSGDGSVCATTSCKDGEPCLKNNGYCYKTVDCNNPSNSSTTECLASSSLESDDQINLPDDTNSSFYRPIPLNKVYTNNDPSQGYRITGSCYSMQNLRDQYDGSTEPQVNGSKDEHWGNNPVIDMSWLPGCGDHHCDISLGYYHYQFGPYDITRSPEACGVAHNGWRGTGYVYLCGNKGNLYNPISEKSAYYKGYVNTTFLDDNDTSSTLKVCLRFKNAMRSDDTTMPDSETCGSRECAISCFSSTCGGQYCGYDVCKDLTVKYSNSKECSINNDLFLNNSDNKPCTELIDSFLRLRAVQYGHQICTFVDVKGSFAYNKMFFDGNEKLDNGTTCVSGSYNSETGKCDGSKDTNTDPGLADRWRTILKVRYTSGNTTNSKGESGFYDKNGKFIKAQECVKVPLTTAPPDAYNLATAQNSLKLFAPPLYIRSVNTERGGTTATDSGTSSLLGTTDFLYPEIVVQFGTTTKTLSMGLGYSGYEVNKDPESYALDSTAITTVLNWVTYSAGVLIKKDIDPANNQPLLCLYQRAINSSGFTDIKIGCVKRSLPEINNANTPSANTLGLRKVSITGSTDNANVLYADGTYGTSSISLKYCSDNDCSSNTNFVTITNLDPSTPTCAGTTDNNLERYTLCAKREYCSQLWKECMENEIAIQNNNATVTEATQGLRTFCQNLATTCNAKKGIFSSSGSLIDQINSTTTDTNAYGWFNELCFVSGFESKLIQVYNATTPAGIGKCKLTSSSPKTCLTTENTAENWANGTCKCLEYTGEPITGYDLTSRTQTPREAGLCVDLPIPKICPAINYGGDAYNAQSLNGTAYTPSGTVNINHDNRNTSDVGASSNGGHGEYPASVVGMISIAGACNGFWQADSSSGTQITPKMSCTDNSASKENGKWSGLSTASNSLACTRFYCSAISTNNGTTGSDANGAYSGNYTEVGETNDSKNETVASAGNSFGITYDDVTLGTMGASNGYAIWSQYTKTNDFLQSTSAYSCLTGFSPGSDTSKAFCCNSAVPSVCNSVCNSSGTLPVRTCNQLGYWGSSPAPTCQRKACPPINPPYNPTTISDWEQWSKSKGATFGVRVYLNSTDGYLGAPVLTNGVVAAADQHVTPASRSPTPGVYTEGSVRKGYCNTRLGYFQAFGGSQPEAYCQSDGTWSETIKNPCVTSCTAVTNPDSSSGWATWEAQNSVPVGSFAVSVGTCKAGYHTYPYNRFRNDDGTLIYPVPAASTSNTESPHRTCQSTTVPSDGGGTASVNVWTATSSTCVNKCPGYDIDTREGVGKTTYSTRNNGTVEVRWDSAETGSYQVKTVAYNANGDLIGTDNKLTINATDYSASNRTNGYFIVSRYCKNDGSYTWDTPLVQCPTNHGIINNIYIGNTTLASGASDATVMSTLIAANSTTSPNTCITNYATSSYPVYKCQATSGSTNIDQYYYAKVSGTDCSRVKCTATNGATYGSGSLYTGPTTTVNAGSSAINLSCKSNYGHALGGRGSDSTCGRSATDRTSSSPTMTCISSNGVGTWSVYNDCVACRSCTISSTTSVSGAPSVFEASWSCNSYSSSVDNIVRACSNANIGAVSHNAYISVGYEHDRKCNCPAQSRDLCLSARIQCIDGEFKYDSENSNTRGGTCPGYTCDSGSRSAGNGC